ncbi:MAG: MerR family DNA-binding protein [Kutzneria sp.]|nr:MerR family DNA-binding protein [Kutzneria sp.]
MRSGELASSAGVNVQTLRYYERRGLLAEPARSGSGYRAYPGEAVRIVRFIRRAQRLGFTLAEVETLLGLAGGGPDRCAATRALATEKLSDLENRIAELCFMRDSLRNLVRTCGRPAAQRDCPLLGELEEER